MVIKAGDTLESITLHVLESELSQGVSKCPLSYYLEASRLARHIYTDITKLCFRRRTRPLSLQLLMTRSRVKPLQQAT